MKRVAGLFETVVSWENLLLAAGKAARGKRSRGAVRQFRFHQEPLLVALQQVLIAGRYRPGKFSTHWITRPKPRLISAAPFIDRVVHHAIMNPLEPVLNARMHPASFACRVGKGTHAASKRLQSLMARHEWIVHCDVVKFFPSIDHDLLKMSLAAVIKDRPFLELISNVIDAANAQEPRTEYFAGDQLWTPHERRKGLPIGNLTSQWFANWFLTGLDRVVTAQRGVGGYVRYCDDFVILGDDRKLVHAALDVATHWLHQHRLLLHEERAQIKRTALGVTFVGYRTWPRARVVRKPTIRRFQRRLRRLQALHAAGVLQLTEIKPRLAGFTGHARQADSVLLLKRLSLQWRFVRASTVNSSCPAGRVVEQQPRQLPLRQSQQEHA